MRISDVAEEPLQVRLEPVGLPVADQDAGQAQAVGARAYEPGEVPGRVGVARLVRQAPSQCRLIRAAAVWIRHSRDGPPEPFLELLLGLRELLPLHLGGLRGQAWVSDRVRPDLDAWDARELPQLLARHRAVGGALRALRG